MRALFALIRYVFEGTAHSGEGGWEEIVAIQVLAEKRLGGRSFAPLNKKTAVASTQRDVF